MTVDAGNQGVVSGIVSAFVKSDPRLPLGGIRESVNVKAVYVA
jgi:hypothetical protein